MDKNIKLEIAVGVVLIIVIMIGGFVWLEKKQQQQIQAVAQSSKSQTTAQLENPVMSDPEGGNTSSVQDDQISDQNTEGAVPIESVKMDMPSSWTVKNIQNRMYIKDNDVKSNYDTSLVLNVKTTQNDVTDMKALQDEGAGTDFTDVEDGKIFKVPNCGALACYGAIIRDNIYSFNWDIQTNDPNPQNARNDFSTDAIWNAMKTVTME